MIIDCISDLHGHFPKLEGGDLLIVAGDLTARHTEKEWHEFASWLDSQNYQKIVFIAGNHDTMIEKWDKEQDEEGYQGPVSDNNDRIEYLCDSGTEFEGLKIWGSPWTAQFPGINPHCCAFTVDTDEELAEKWKLIPDDIDILVTHSPPFGILDMLKKDLINGKACIPGFVLCGSKSLSDKMEKLPRPKLHVFGHIHEFGGKRRKYGSTTIMVNASILNEHYESVNKPVRVIL